MRDRRYLIGWGMSTALRFASSRPGTARAVLNADGTALVQTATQDIGTGTYTIMAQIAADARSAYAWSGSAARSPTPTCRRDRRPSVR